MDHKQFDELVVKLTSAPSRRDALKGLIGGTLASIGVAADTLAKGKGGGKGGGGKGGGKGGHKGGGKGHNKNNKNKCGAGKKRCDGNCRNITNSVAHCGSCNNHCLTGQVCRNGQCVAPS